MSAANSSHQNTYNVLLVKRLLSTRDGVSPFTLLIDSLDQSADVLLNDIVARAKVANTTTIYISFENLKGPLGSDHFIKARRKSFADLQAQVRDLTGKVPRSVVLIDTLHPLVSSSQPLAGLLLPFIGPTTSLVAVYHNSIPIAGSAPAYAPPALSTLKYLATTIIHVYSLRLMQDKHQAAQKSLPDPVTGLEEQRDGIILSLNSNSSTVVILEIEHRRKSGRGIHLNVVLSRSRDQSAGQIVLLDHHKAFRSENEQEPEQSTDESVEGLSFNLSLTDKQKKARENVVLPYFDAQKGGGQGGRILYEMGREDDFDEEEDEL